MKRKFLLLGLIVAMVAALVVPTAVSAEPNGALGAAGTTGGANLLQFTSDGNVLGFNQDGVIIASADHALKMNFLNSNLVTPEADNAVSESPGNGAVPALNKVTYNNVWNGVTIVYSANEGAIMESSYYLDPINGLIPVNSIRLGYNRPVSLDKNGNLVVTYENGTIMEATPVAWQEINGQQQPVTSAYVLYGNNEVGFSLGKYVPGVPVVIDPVLTWNTFLGGSGNDWSTAIAVDGSGNVYVGGWSDATWGTNPVRGFTSVGSGTSYNIFAAKLDSGGNLLWNTFLGNSPAPGAVAGTGIAVDSIGNVYVAGTSTATWGAPVVPYTSGNENAFAAQLNSSGVVQWNTFLAAGGTSGYGNAIAVDISGVYVAGTNTTSGDAFVAEVSSSGDLQWATSLGNGTLGKSQGNAIAVEGGNIYVAGSSQATWQGTNPPVQAHTTGTNYDAFVAEVNGSGAIQWNTFLGSAGGSDYGTGIAVDSNGNVYVVGYSNHTWGANPVVSGPMNQENDAFAAKLDSGGNLQWNTFMGSEGSGLTAADEGEAIALDGSGNVYISGYSGSTWGKPVWAFTSNANEAFAVELDNNGNLQWNTFLGGSAQSQGYAIAVEGVNVYVGGYSWSTWGASTVRPFTGSNQNAFAADLGPNPATLTTANITVTGASTAQAGVQLSTVLAPTDTTATYVWETDASGSYLAISGATESTYTPAAGDVGHNLEVMVTIPATDATYAASSATSSPTAAVLATYALTMAVSPSGEGTATDQTGTSPYIAGAQVSIEAVANAGYQFVNWTAPSGTITSATSATTTFTMPANAVTVTANFEIIPPATYALTMAVSPSGEGTATDQTGTSPYIAGAQVSIKAAANAGYQFVNWTAPSGTITSATSATTTFTMPANAVTVTANFEIIPPATYALTMAVSPSGEGTATDETGTSPYIAGAQVSIKAAANAGYQFVNWTAPSGTITSATSATTTFTMPANAVTVTANFEIIPPATYALTMAVSPSGEGTATDQTGTSPYIAGAQVSIKAVANAGYQFVNWTAPSGTITSATSATTTFTMPANAVTVTANFEIIPPATYALTMAVSPSGEGTATDQTGTSPYIAGAQVSIEAVANAGYQFVNWTAPSGTITSATSATTTFTMPANAVTVTANFEIIPPATYALTMAVSPSGEGTATDQTGTSPYIAGAQVSIKAAANAGYQFVNWTAPSGTITSATSATTTFTMPANAVTVTANFEIIPPATYALTMAVSPSGEGTATDETGTSPYIAGAQVSIKAAANAGYQFVNWTAPSGTITSATSATTTFTMPANAVTVTANFEIIPPATYALTMAVSPSGEGTATDQTGTSPYIAGAQVSIKAAANAGYQFVNWTAPSGTITSATSATTTFTMPANAVTVTANFEIIPPATYALTMAVSPSGEGTATDQTGTSPYIAGAQVSIKAVANAGYQFVNWTAPSGTITSATSATTTFTMPANAVTVTANFEIIPPATYALTMAVSPSGEGTATDETGTSPYIAGAQVSIKAVANAGYQFVNWTAPSGTITSATSATTTFTMPANAVTVTANFEIIPPATYALTMAVSPSGEGTATDQTGTSPYIAGAQVSIKAVANAGYQFVNWTAPSGTITSATSATTTFTMPANAVTVTANFEIIPPATYALTMAVSPSGEGTATDETGTSPYIAGAQVSIKAAANAGYQFVNWTAPSGTITSATSATTTFTMPANAVTVTANFEIIPPATYALTMAVSPSGEGTATDQTGTSPYIAGAQVSIKAVANAGYQFVNWTAPSGTITSATSATTTFTMPANAVTVTANFEIIPPATYALTMAVSPSGEGTATDETGTSPYIAGAQVSIKAAANAGYQFVNWTAPSGTITSATSATTTFTMPANAVTVTANFEIIPPATYALTMAVSPSGEGTATDQTGTSPYIAGAQVSIKAAANAGYQFVNWTAPSGTITSATSATTTFTMPANAVTVTANFEIIPPATYALTMAVSPSGEGTATDQTGTSPYIAGAQVSIKAAANAGYQFVNWTAPSGTITSATSATTTFTMPANAVTVTANFEIIPTSAGITVGKGSTVGSGSSLSGVPYVEASWVQEPDNNITLWNGDTSTIIAEHMESGDPIHVTPGTQINPPMIFDSSKTIDFYTVVGDPDGIGSLSDVYGYVYSPSNSPAPYNTPTDPNGNPFFKYKVTYTNLGNGPAAQALVTAAYNAGLIAFGTVPTTGNDQYATSETWTGSYTLSNLVNSSGTGELQKNVADLYMGQGVLTYEQPAGQYNVDVYAEDTLDYVSPALMNPFTYVALTGVETDFTSINYGAVALKIDKTIAGDVTWNSPAGVNNATVRNIGNTWTQVTVAQDDEGFGVDGTEAPMAYVDTTPPTFSSTPTSGVSTNWNVYFDACMGSNGANAEMYYTPTAKGSPMTNVVTLPGVLGLSTMNELDFSIYINDGNGSHSGSMTISSVYVPFGAAGATANGGGVVTVEPPIISTPITPSTTTTTKTTTTGG